MSSNLYWRPVDVNAERLPKSLKFAISRRLWDTDGSCGSGEAVMSVNDIPYLEGLRDAGVDGAKELIGHIEKHGAVILWHEH